MLKSESYTTVLLVHMVIARATCLEDCHTHPANVSLAAHTGHMIASLRLLHWGFAFRTVFNVEFSLQLLECLIST